MATTATGGTDYGALLKDTFQAFTRQSNLVPLIVGALVLAIGSLTVILAPPLALGYVNLCLKISRGEPGNMDDLWSGFSRFGAALVVGLLAAVAISIGFIFLIIPGFVLAVLFTFAFHVMSVRPELSAFDVLKASATLVKENLVDVLVLWLLGGVLNAVLSVLVVGPILGAAFTMLFSALMFQRITPSPGEGL